MIGLKLTIWFAFIVAHAWRDYHLITIEKRHPIYWKSFLFIRFPAGALYLLLWDWHNIIHACNYILFECTSFWLLFPLLLNGMRCKEPFYLGKSSGYFDKHFIKHPVQFRIALLLALALFILSVIVIYQR